jgi:RNA polymerase sigma-70 factor (ECF subfamily)
MSVVAEETLEGAPRAPIPTEEATTLIARSKRGDTDAFRQLVEQHTRYAFALAFRLLTDEEDAQDVVQDAFIRVWTSQIGRAHV